MKQLFVNIKSFFENEITNDFGNKPISQINFDDSGNIVSIKVAWIRTAHQDSDLFLTSDGDNKFKNSYGNLIGEIL